MFSFHSIHEADVKKVFLSGNVLAKTVRTVVDDDRNWDYLLKQIANPQNNRPIKPLDKGVERSRRYNYFLKAWESVVLLNERGGAKETIYTKKCQLHYCLQMAALIFIHMGITFLSVYCLI